MRYYFYWALCCSVVLPVYLYAIYHGLWGLSQLCWWILTLTYVAAIVASART